ncbi:MAG: hypothetical protein JRJ60_21415 [Deltaproteobacteria bacterium]|nr:hypothetical protein [Deltaproteobacteria bacterium]
MFLSHNPEYVWDGHLIEVPDKIFFGPPYGRGWKTAGALFRSGELKGTFHSNEKRKISQFYLRRYSRHKGYADYIIKTFNPQSWRYLYPIPSEFRLVAEIYSGNRPGIFIYGKGSGIEKPRAYQAGDLEDLYHSFDKIKPSRIKEN